MSIAISEHAFDPKSHLSEVMWTDTLAGMAEYQKLEAMQKAELAKLESSVLIIGIDAAERERRAHLAAGYRKAISLLHEHHAAHLKAHQEEAKKEDSGAPTVRPPVL